MDEVKEEKKVEMVCSFCKKKQSEVAVMIASDSKTCICSECVLLSVGVIFEHVEKVRKQIDIITDSLKRIEVLDVTNQFPQEFKDLIRQITKIGG